VYLHRPLFRFIDLNRLNDAARCLNALRAFHSRVEKEPALQANTSGTSVAKKHTEDMYWLRQSPLRATQG
ncbi:MAG: hypothetical protein ACREAM_07075, partial [Blastocatellia bacterium]